MVLKRQLLIATLIANKEKAEEAAKSKKIIDNNNGDNKRTYSILSYFIVLVLLGKPIWWYTTRVYRATLPLNAIDELQLRNKTVSEFGIPLSLEYDLLINFVHPDPSSLSIDVDILQIDAALDNFAKKHLPIADFFIKSQWLYLTELGVIPHRVNGHLALSESQLPHIITPLESKFWSHLSPRPSINLVVYFPHCKSPLYIYDNNNVRSQTNAFVSPRWGGVFILNPDNKSCEQGNYIIDARTTVSTFEQMLLELFRVSNNNVNAATELKQRKTYEMLESSKKTLKSLAQLLSEIKSIVISDEIADKVNVAVENINAAEELILKGKLDDALVKAKVAFQNSEEAFGHPSLLALLYFPDDQKYAIYIPLFLPVMIPVVMSLTQIKNKLFKSKQK
ncbi:GPI transamidase component PIG-S-like [Sitophilus oryzae]|uniref:GPI transamidase component PIG-S-like n=1 Tax=Sitophilus oryzae TaxID=7048 RepID=A0A6J2XJW1_SITOR|nr:GPI transamidase component PIG-S-like [Sitophilus oryzae]